MKHKMVQTVVGFQRYIQPEMCYFNEYTFPGEKQSTSQRISFICEKMIDIENTDIDVLH